MAILNKKVKALLFADGIWFFGEGMLGPLFAVFAQKIGGDVLDISWAWSVYLIVYGVMTMLVGKISDDKIKKRMVGCWRLCFKCYFDIWILICPDKFRPFDSSIWIRNSRSYGNSDLGRLSMPNTAELNIGVIYGA